MTLFARAMQSDNVNTISLLVQIGGKQGIALVDSGSNSTFISLKFALSTNFIILKDTSRAVAVAGGGCLFLMSHLQPSLQATPSSNNNSEYYISLDMT